MKKTKRVKEYPELIIAALLVAGWVNGDVMWHGAVSGLETMIGLVASAVSAGLLGYRLGRESK